MPAGHSDLGVYLGGHGKTLLQLQRFEDAEKALTEAHGIHESTFGIDHKRTIGIITLLAKLYTVWHKAEPDKGYDKKAEEWRTKLEAINSETEEESKQDDLPLGKARALRRMRELLLQERKVCGDFHGGSEVSAKGAGLQGGEEGVEFVQVGAIVGLRSND